MDNEFSQVAGYKISLRRSVSFLYTNNELSEIRKTAQFTIASKRIKFLGRNKFNGDERSIHENYKTLMKEIDNDKCK